MNQNADFLFRPLQLRSVTLPNRVVMMPMGSDFAGPNGELTDEHIRYYQLRARGGTGLILVENVCVTYPQGSNGTTQLRMDRDCFIPRLFTLTQTCHRYGAVMGVQINHAGASGMSSRIGMQPVSASDLPSKPGGEIPRPLSREELEQIAQDYGAAAKRAVNAGFDLVEIHAGHSYLISQFLSPTMNNRTDEFGGSAENRSRFCRMVIDQVRKAVGPKVPISLRLSVDELIEGGNTIEDCLEYLTYLNDEVDLFDTSCGLNPTIQYQIDSNFLQDGWRSYMARAVREKFGKPTIAMGNVRDPAIAEQILERGDADLIGIGRGLIADPAWARKARMGHWQEIRRCISCNTGCVGNRIGGNKPLRCAVNPDLIDGESYKNHRITRPCQVVVIGGGTAGLEAACTAAEVGADVTLLEKADHLGGLSVEISKLPAKTRLADFPQYLIHRAKKLPRLQICLQTEATAELLRGMSPNLVVNASGSVPLLPPIEGLREQLDQPGSNVYTVLDLIDAVKDLPHDFSGKKVAVIGGGAVGLDVVEYFAPRGAQVTLVELTSTIGQGLDASTAASMRECLTKYQVEQRTETTLTRVSPHTFTIKHGEEQTELVFDYGFICLGMTAFCPHWPRICDALSPAGVHLLNIGDSVHAGRIIDGTDAGRHMVLAALDQMGCFDAQPYL